MSKCPDCGSDENSCDCAFRHMREELGEISEITMREAAYYETLTPKINQINEMVNLLIRLKNEGVK